MADPTQTPQAPRIAIKFGSSRANSTKPASSTRKSGQLLPPSALGKRPRSHALNNDSDSEDEDSHYGRHEAVTTVGGKDDVNDRQRDAKSARTEGRPLVIACQTEGSWKAAARRKPEDNSSGQDRETEPADHEKDIKWGLSITKKSSAEDSTGDAPGNPLDGSPTATATEKTPNSPPRTVEQNAMDALLGIDTNKQKKLVISGSETPTDEFKAAVQAAGEVSTIEEYDQIPDGEFGMAMLRGMGYDESKQTSRPKDVRRRPALLGLGAKEDEEIKKAELAKKHGHRERRPRLDEYRRGENEKRQQREEKYSSSYKHERDRERSGHGSSRKYDDRDRARDRYRDREGESSRHRDRHSRR
ncbi:hypothetical protein PFICI_11536 [Pestalotiopsis fici W106-1]|uniref:Pre-mRNA-splicing factor n=1 Tax=Pestalotiopsis fici (strain W106-1 / CGMCC3.15140) TaxID=1229662 RepID=W3WQQ9_PESFW|nr:uncharacterized protein PFICI_11536 [Pestalotiopsis fici W106-1]ETS76149.1 hypothetical protein PFICI_11536 [Pestalotiopsis fici W106-1]